MRTFPDERAIVNSDLARSTAEDAACRPEVKRWIRRLRKLIRDMPDGIEVFVGESVAVRATGPGGKSFMTEGECADPCSVIDSINDRRWDGGGW